MTDEEKETAEPYLQVISDFLVKMKDMPAYLEEPRNEPYIRQRLSELSGMSEQEIEELLSK